MSLRSLVCIGLIGVVLSSAGHSQPMPKLGQILPRVQDHVKEFESSLPDFICDEKITSKELMGGTTIHETDIDSTFRGTQNRDKNPDGKYEPFTEWRDIQTIDGRPAPKGQQLTGPFLFGGGFSSILVEIFSPENSRYFNYKVIGTDKVDKKTAVLIKFETKKDQQALLHRELFGSQYVMKGSGKAWIDPSSMNVLRLEIQYLDPPMPEGVLSLAVDYAPVVIQKKTFWMPRTVTAEQTIPNPRVPVGGQYVAEYSNYQEFKVSVKIKY
ncbi:MAG: hypothetical protein LAO76_24500 [Acidobacteriia bacterium]|nr:hypothetical protein [Terriglobia bacterium]